MGDDDDEAAVDVSDEPAVPSNAEGDGEVEGAVRDTAVVKGKGETRHHASVSYCEGARTKNGARRRARG